MGREVLSGFSQAFQSWSGLAPCGHHSWKEIQGEARNRLDWPFKMWSRRLMEDALFTNPRAQGTQLVYLLPSLRHLVPRAARAGSAQSLLSFSIPSGSLALITEVWKQRKGLGVGTLPNLPCLCRSQGILSFSVSLPLFHDRFCCPK